MSLADKLTTVAENIPKVYQAGYDSFWDSYQNNGTRKNYHHGFRGEGWKTSFKPKYDMQPTHANAMFAGWGYAAGKTFDLVEMLEEAGVTLDLSKATMLAELFNSNTVVTHVGVIDISSATNGSHIFNCASVLKTIDKFIVTDKTTTLTGAFDYCHVLENIVIEGTIGANIDLHWSTKLTKDSILGVVATEEQIASNKSIVTVNGTKYYGGIIAALSDSTTGKTLTLSRTAIDAAFETHEGIVDGSSSPEWNALTGTKTNWTISLI